MKNLPTNKDIEMAKPKEETRQSDTLMSLEGHIEEFRKRVLYALFGTTVSIIACLFFGPRLITCVREPYTSIMVSEGLEPRLQSLAPSDGFVTYVKISALAGVILASPWIFYHLWQFVAAGLYPVEKRAVNVAAPISALLFATGAAFFITIVAPFTLRFFIVFNKKLLGIDSAFTFEKYVSFVINMMLVFGLAFQTPTAIFFINKIGVISLSALSKSRKYVLLAVFMLAAIITPPDFVSQVTLALPLYLLFELGIMVSRFANR